MLVLAFAAIVCLLGLAGYLTVYINEDSASPKSAAVQTDAALVELEPSDTTKSNSSPSYGQDGYVELEHSYIFVGDSRTVGMRDAVQEYDTADTCTYIAKEGEGFHWLYNDGIVQLEAALKENPDATVIFNLGVNDLKEVDKYISFYQELFQTYHDPAFYIMSVNPVNDELCKGASNAEIQAFNQAMQEAFPDQYMDCFNYLLSEDWSTVDGLHYTKNTYRRIHHFAVMILTA